MGRYKHLIKNIELLTLSSFSTKLLNFFLIPLYTNILSTAEYGTYDLFSTTTGVLLPVLTLNIQESVMRFSLDNKLSRRSILSVGTRYLMGSSVLVAVGLVVNGVFGFSAVIRDYSIYFFLIFFTQALSNIVLAYIRGVDRIADLSVSSVVSSLAVVLCNILFLVIFKWGLVGYFSANIIGPCAQCLYLMLRAGVFQEIRLTEKFESETREMLAYSKPLIANSIAWWVNSASDRYVVIWFCGLSESGIYSAASKIPAILNVFQSIFAQAWTLSAVKNFDPEDKNGFFANTYAAYNCLMTIMCSAVIVADKILAKFLYARDFYMAWKYVPWLTIAIVFGSLTGYVGGFFSAVKNSKLFAQSTMIGAVTNVVLSIILTPFLGALGAAVATAICYCVTWVFRYIHVQRIIRLRVRLGRDIVTYILLVVQSAVLLILEEPMKLYAAEIGLFAVVTLLYLNDIGSMLQKYRNASKRHET